MQIGSGEHVYEAIHDWGTPPSRVRWGNTHAVQVDRQGFVYVFHTVHEGAESDHAVVVFDADGKFVRSWGGAFAGGAHGMQLRREGGDEVLYLTDIRRSIVQKTDPRGNVLLTLGYPTESPAYQRDDQRRAAYWKPTNVAVARSGDIYVADGYGSSHIVVFDADGRYKNTFGGGRTDRAGDLYCPHGIWIDDRMGVEEVLVADRMNHRLQYFDLDGKHLRFVDGVDLPCHFDVSPDGLLLIPDLARRVTLLDRDNRVLAHLGVGLDDWEQRREAPRDQFQAGKFICPHGACFDHAGDIYVVEWVEIGRITKLERR